MVSNDSKYYGDQTLFLTIFSYVFLEDFNINFTYPKKIVNSIIEDENLEGRERFR